MFFSKGEGIEPKEKENNKKRYNFGFIFQK